MVEVAGVGPGSIKNMTLEVYERIKDAPTVVAFGRVSDSIKSIRTDVISVNRVSEVLDIAKNENDVLILASGDPPFFGITTYLKKQGITLETVYPGISSFQYMLAKLQLPWSEAYLFSLHGREFDLEELLRHPLSVGLTDGKNKPSLISKELYQLGIRGTLIIGYNLSYGEEKIERIEIGESIRDVSDLAIVVIDNEMAKRQ